MNMKPFSPHLVLLALTLLLSSNVYSSTEQTRTHSPRGTLAFECPYSGYDNQSVDDSIFFGGGHAGDPDYMMGVNFKLSDFNHFPGRTQLEGFCVGNNLAFAGGPWANEIFLYADLGNGMPDLTSPIAQATIKTGDGRGDHYITLDPPIALDGNFWLIVRGDPSHAGEDFNLEIEVPQDPQFISGRSYLTDLGINYWHQVGGNWLIRANLTATAPPPPIPAISALGVILLVIAILLAAFAPLWRQYKK